MRTVWPLGLFSKSLRFWRPPPVNLPNTVTACAWEYRPKPPFLVIAADLETLKGAVRATTLDAACRHLSVHLDRPLSMIHAIIDARAMIVLAVSYENEYSGCAIAWDALARHHDPLECAILETWAREGMT